MPKPDYEWEYDNRARVADSETLVAKWETDAAAFREEWPHATYDIAYGPGKRDDVDIFWPEDRDETAPMVVFVHGGYWRSRSRKDFSHLARGLVETGHAVAMPSYSLAPDAHILAIVREVQQCCIFLHRTYERPLTAIGHSAGGHLAACLFATEWTELDPALPRELIRAGLGLSGIYDLMPLLQTTQNETIGLDEEFAHAASVHRWRPIGVRRFEAWAGGDETPEYRRQSRTLVTAWRMLGIGAKMEVMEGANHFTIVDPLTDANSNLVRRVADLVRQPELTLQKPTRESAEKNEAEKETAGAPVEKQRPSDVRPVKG